MTTKERVDALRRGLFPGQRRLLEAGFPRKAVLALPRLHGGTLVDRAMAEWRAYRDGGGR